MTDLDLMVGNGICTMTLVNWKNPIQLNIGNLPAIALKHMIVPKEENRNLNILGVDVLHIHTIIISSSDANVNYKILPGNFQSSPNIIVVNTGTKSLFERFSFLSLVENRKFAEFLYSTRTSNYVFAEKDSNAANEIKNRMYYDLSLIINLEKFLTNRTFQCLIYKSPNDRIYNMIIIDETYKDKIFNIASNYLEDCTDKNSLKCENLVEDIYLVLEDLNFYLKIITVEIKYIFSETLTREIFDVLYENSK